jgi:hypothetical protein
VSNLQPHVPSAASVLRPRCVYTRRVVQKAVEAVHRDGIALRCVPDRLARDFWVRPDEKMVGLWCHAYAAQIDFAIDYQPWVIATFSGMLCVDEVYQGDLALLLAVRATCSEAQTSRELLMAAAAGGALAARTAGALRAARGLVHLAMLQPCSQRAHTRCLRNRVRQSPTRPPTHRGPTRNIAGEYGPEFSDNPQRPFR